MAKQVEQVFAFEPEQRNFELLQKNIDLNKLDNVDPRNVAASANSGKSILYLCGSNRGMHRLYKSEWCDEGAVTVQTIAIDDVIEYADFVKMDIEGAELGALKGM